MMISDVYYSQDDIMSALKDSDIVVMNVVQGLTLQYRLSDRWRILTIYGSPAWNPPKSVPESGRY